MSAKSVGAVWIAVALVVGLVVGAGGFYAFSSLVAPPVKPSLLETIKSRGVLIVGTSADWPPFEYIDSKGNFAGIDMVIADRIAREIGVKLEVRD
ncbi:MAG: transporter substrate-binding domain-containing protein, partial [Nitrososphaerota archaeon]